MSRSPSNDGAPGDRRARIVRALLKLARWELVGSAPDVPRCVVIFAPHTSNWDFPILLLVRFAFRRPVHYLGKHTLFRFPFGWFFRWTGGIPVDRGESQKLVRGIARRFGEREALWIAMAPEGTRRRTDHWKSGFYYLALEARVPVLLAFIDAGRRQCGLGPLVELSGDVERDFGTFRAFYADKPGIRPELASDVRLQP